MSNDNSVYWVSPLGIKDDFGELYKDVMYDGRTNSGPWANMAAQSWRIYGVGKLGTGYGQKYKKQADGRWLKVEG
jgi:hypothetical protein